MPARDLTQNVGRASRAITTAPTRTDPTLTMPGGNISTELVLYLVQDEAVARDFDTAFGGAFINRATGGGAGGR